jgi:SPP1 gp7 family putative phage head morphogenesis protein
MSNWRKGVNKYLNKAEYDFLKEYDRWIKEVFAHIPYGADEHAIHNFTLSTTTRLSSILFKHSSKIFSAGQEHGGNDCKAILDKRKLSELPTIVMRHAWDDDPFTPFDAIQQLKKRSIYLAGDVERKITDNIKKILIDHLIGTERKWTEVNIANLLKSNMDRASLIVTTETSYAYNRGRLFAYKEYGADYVQYSATMDARTCEICASRHGKIMKTSEIGDNTPPVHGRCRCVLSPIYSDVQSNLLTDSALDWSNVKPLPKGWVS